jgi:hypothetical protein
MTVKSTIRDAAIAPPIPFAPGDELARMRRDEPRFTQAGLLFLMALPVFAAAGLIDDRLHLGIDIWIKPAKFALALAIYLLTLAVTARFLTVGFRGSLAYRTFSAVVVASCAAELVWVAGAAALGTSSHFNTEHAFLAAIYSLMGLIAVTLTSATTVHAWGIVRNAATGLAPTLRESLVLGLGLTLPLTLMTAGTMAGMGGHGVGGSGLDTSAAPIMGWLRDAGDLRVGHFFATHALHFIPAFGLAAGALGGGVWPVRAFAAAFSAVVMFTFVQALGGMPFLGGWI